MRAHPLDRAVWNALTGRRAALAFGDAGARRLLPSIGLFAAAASRTTDDLAALGSLVAPGEQVAMIEAERWPAPRGLHPVGEAACVQMIGPDAVAVDLADDRPPIVALTDIDAPAMLELATLPRPGPFAADTHRFGGFVGIREGGTLVAMAGTRLAVPGFVEVSGVCTHPAHRGRGHAAALILHVARAIVAGGDRPFLTTYADNAVAIALYRSLGFTVRRELVFTTFERG